MEVAIIGGTGFVGGHLVDAIVAAGHRPALLVRRGSESKVQRKGECRIVSGDLDSNEAIRETLSGAQAVIYNVGILREFPDQGITFERLQYDGAARTMEAAGAAGIRRFLLMSANGVRAGGTPYQDTKYRAEQKLECSGLDYTIFRPSVIFGDPRGKMEFATQLHRDMIAPPLPAVEFRSMTGPGDGRIRMSPVHVEDVAAAFVAALDDPATHGRTFELGGPEVLTWRDLIDRIGAAVGKHKLVLPMPVELMRAGAALLDRFAFFPVTRDQLTMLVEGNTADPAALEALIGHAPRAFSPENLAYLAAR
jgi:NADH dehydrogenase